MKTPSILLVVFLIVLTGVVIAHADVRHHQINKDNSIVFVENDSWEPQGFRKAAIVRARSVKDAPAIDGLSNDPAWNHASAVSVPLRYGSVREATLKVVYTEQELFLLVSWADPTKDDKHRPWLWSETLRRYIEGSQVEDSLLVSFEGGCDWSPSLLAGYVYDFDAWRWLAARSDPLGQAVDSDGSVQNHWVPRLGFVKYQTRSPSPFWNLKFIDFRNNILTRPWNELKRMYKWAPIVKKVFVRYQADGSPTPVIAERLEPPTVATHPGKTFPDADIRLVRTTPKTLPPRLAPQFRPVKLTGDAGEVAAKGRWENGRWTVEFRRALLTPARTGSDSVFNRTSQLSIHVFDRTERVDESSESGRILLQFEPSEPSTR